MKQVLKYFYLLFTLMIVFTGTVFSQSGWVRQYPPPEAQNITFLGVSFVNADTGYIVGGYGTILHTTNGGTDWNIQISGTTNWLRGVSADGANTATAVGDSGIILHTTNGGTTWISQTSGTINNLRGVSFPNSSTGTVVGDSGTILRTTNGGTTWMSLTSGTVNNLRGVSFPNSSTGTAVGDSGTILRTINGGTTWTSQVSQDIDQKTDKLYGVCFTDADTGTAVGYTYFFTGIEPSSGPGGIVINTKDGGKTWNTEPTPYVSDIFSDSTIFGVSFTDAYTGTVIGLATKGSYAGIIWRRTNGTNGWVNQSFGNRGFYGVCFTDVNTGTIVGDSGTIYHTTTGGVTGIKDNPAQLPDNFLLEQNYPNPFNPSTVISYRLPVISHVTLKVYDVLGREVATLVNGVEKPGNHSVSFNASNLPSGVYFYKLQAKTEDGQEMVYNATKKLSFLK
jgi:photosystem II stability/assembly factor-like uncharacterized protein